MSDPFAIPLSAPLRPLALTGPRLAHLMWSQTHYHYVTVNPTTLPADPAGHVDVLDAEDLYEALDSDQRGAFADTLATPTRPPLLGDRELERGWTTTGTGPIGGHPSGLGGTDPSSPLTVCARADLDRVLDAVFTARTAMIIAPAGDPFLPANLILRYDDLLFHIHTPTGAPLLRGVQDRDSDRPITNHTTETHDGYRLHPDLAARVHRTFQAAGPWHEAFATHTVDLAR